MIKYCECGCGKEVKSGNRFICGHNRKKPNTIKICKQCGKEFTAEGSIAGLTRKFCSKDCRYKYQSEYTKGINRVNRIIIHCDYCNESFMIRETEMYRRFCCHKCYTDWYSENLIGVNNPSYKDKIIKLCEYCGCEMELSIDDQRRFCSKDCYGNWMSENLIGENSLRRIDKTIKSCEYCGVEMKIVPCEDQKRFCSKECKNSWYSENNCGENNPGWKGGVIAYNARRRLLGYEPLNDKFPGSNGHHITRTLVIHIPEELHQHIGHNLRSGRNMDIINILAFQYLSGYYNE